MGWVTLVFLFLSWPATRHLYTCCVLLSNCWENRLRRVQRQRLRRRLTTGNSNVATHYSYFISESMIVIVEIPTPYLDFRPQRDRQNQAPTTKKNDMADETGSNIGLISRTNSHGVKISTANPGFWTVTNSLIAYCRQMKWLRKQRTTLCTSKSKPTPTNASNRFWAKFFTIMTAKGGQVGNVSTAWSHVGESSRKRSNRLRVNRPGDETSCYRTIILKVTRSSATAKRQRVSYARLFGLAQWSCTWTSLNSASVVQLF